MAPLALVITTGDVGGYLCPVDEAGLAHLLERAVDHVPLTPTLVAIVHADSVRPGAGGATTVSTPNPLAARLATALRVRPSRRLNGTVVLMSIDSRGVPVDLDPGVIALARRTLSPLDHVIDTHPAPLPRTYAVVDPANHENVVELLQVDLYGRVEVREAHGWFPHPHGLPSGTYSPPVIEVSSMQGLELLIDQVDQATTVRRRVRGSASHNDPWGQFQVRLLSHLLEPGNTDAEGRTCVVVHHLDPVHGSPLTQGRPYLALSVDDSSWVRVELPANPRLLAEVQINDLTLRRLRRAGWHHDEVQDLHVLAGDSVLLPRFVEHGLASLRDTFAVDSPDHLMVTLVAGGRTIRASDRLSLLGAPRPLALSAEPPHRS